MGRHGAQPDLVLRFSRESLPGKPDSLSESAKQVLLVENDSFFRYLVKGYLEEEGYKVTLARNGRIGLDCMDETEFDLIVSDIEMPIMDGFNFLKNVRQGTHQQDIPAVALTSRSSDKDRKKAMERGFDRYEVKLDRKRFLTAVAELLGEEKKQY